MQNLFLKHIRQNRLCEPRQRLLLTVSGGLDSMVMLHLFASADFSVGVAHCNFQLRGEESDRDEQFVSEKCRQLQIPFYTKRFDTNNYAAQNQVSIQMAARELRYAWFNELMADEKFDLIATAHHQNDSIETVFINLIHGRGLDGLTGIPVKNNNIIRPLLFATREEIEKYATDHFIAWREDSSNQSDDYKRNFIRHQVIPKLKQLNTSLEESVSRAINKNKGALELEKLGIQAFESQFISKQGARISIQKKAFNEFQFAEAVLYEIVKSHGFSPEQCEQIIPAMNGQTGKNFMSSTHQLVIDREALILTPLINSVNEVQIDEGQTNAIFGSWIVKVETSNDFDRNSSSHLGSIDADKIQYPIVWRSWREGDFFYPLGMEHKKKISDFLIDQKVSLNDKALVSVLESNGEIFWVPGYRISNRFKITKQTKRVLCFTIAPYFV